MDRNPNTGEISVAIVSLDECKHLVDEVCVNPSSDQCCDFPHPDYCMYCCPYFSDEDGSNTTA